MTGEVPQPEQEGTPEVRLFNVDAMNDEQIILLNRALSATAEQETLEDSFAMSGSLLNQLATDVRDLASRDPERVKQLVHRWAKSSESADREIAAEVASSVVHYDYDFVRDALIFIYAGMPDGESCLGASEVAAGAIPELIRDYLTPEQAGDFRARLSFYGEQ